MLKGLLTGIVTVDIETDDFFEVDANDYTKLVGKSFINNKLGLAVKVIGIPEGNENHHWTPIEFLYEAFYQYRDKTWHQNDYIWLQHQAYGKFAKEEYIQLCITPQTDINIASENAFLLGKDGCLYQTVSCGDDYYRFKPLKDSKFEKIRNEAIENDGEYEVQSW